MIAADTCSWIAYLKGESAEDTDLLDYALANRQLLMPPVVLAELLSDPGLDPETAAAFARVPLIELTHEYWNRAGRLRARVLAKRREARLGDALIAQTCLDGGVPLITRDADFRAFAEAAGLDILLGR